MGVDSEFMGYNIEDNPCLKEDVTCTFTVINAGFLTTIGIIGTILSSFTIYCLIFHVKLPQNQNLFILNVAASDVLIAILGTIRGLGIISPTFIGYNKETGKQNWWCSAYTFFGNTVWMSAIPVLVPLTLDRFVAMVFPLKHEFFMTKVNCKRMIAATWLSLIPIIIFDIVTFHYDMNQLVYQDAYHRCVFEADLAWKKSIYVLFPFTLIMIMYGTMVFYVKRAKQETRKLLIVSTLIIVTGLITNIPDQLLITFKVKMSYEAAQVFVTFWYTNSIWNPIIYFASNKRTKQSLAATSVGKTINSASESLARRFSDIKIIDITITFSNETATSASVLSTHNEIVEIP